MISVQNISTSTKYVVALDVGGTTISAGLVGRDCSLIPQKPLLVQINHKGTMTEILETVVDAVVNVRNMSKEKVAGVGIGMPGGPNDFDHEHGISYVKHKFQKLYSKNIKDLLEDAFGLPVYFVNDAQAFALGAWRAMNPDAERLLGITLGTGFGACFLEKGVALRRMPRVPDGGEIWNIPWRSGIVEDFVSRRFIEGEYRREHKKQQGLPLFHGVKEIAKAAREDDRAALYAFKGFAENLGHALGLVVPRFRPDIIVVGGQISKAFDLFARRAQEILEQDIGFSCRMVQTSLGDATAIVGAGYHCWRKLGILH